MSKAENELPLYWAYLDELRDLAAKIADLQISDETYGVSSPRIKSKDEAKYQSGTKVYLDDAALARMMRQESRRDQLVKAREEYVRKMYWCMTVMRKIMDLTDEQKNIIWLHYGKGHSVRAIARMTYQSKDSVYRQLKKIAEKYDCDTVA